MAATMIIGSETHHMPVWLKARLLKHTVETTDDANVLTVESGTDRNKRHSVTYDQHVALSCSCPAVGTCAHCQAVEQYLREQPGEMEAIADQIIAEEKAAKEQASRKAAAIARANEYRRQLEQSPWNSPLVVTNSKAAKQAVAAAEAHLAEQRRNKIEAFPFMR